MDNRQSCRHLPASNRVAMTDSTFRLCSSCKKPLAFGALYYRCSVSTCNRKPLELTFCSLPCWEAHLPAMRHREAWAEEQRAPTAQQHAKAIAEEAERNEPRAPARVSQAKPSNPQENSMAESDEIPQDVLIVVSKIKKYIKARSGMNTSDGIVEALSEQVRAACDAAIRSAGQAGRRTVMARDFTSSSE